VRCTETVLRLSVVVPAYNEAQRIESSLRRLFEYLNQASWDSEVIVVDDGSRDETLALVHNVPPGRVAVHVLDNVVNRGKGFSVRRGMLAATGRYALFCDADLSTPIDEVENLIRAIDAGADVAIGSRALPRSDVRVHQPWWRETMGRTFNWFVQALVPGIADSQCGFKCFRVEAAHRIFERQRLDRFAFDVEVLCVARLLGYRISEVPVVWINHPLSKVDPIRDSTRMLLDLLRIRWNIAKGVYEDEG
jgi:dolichyl-phosphate beta-glucosyltransferase